MSESILKQMDTQWKYTKTGDVVFSFHFFIKSFATAYYCSNDGKVPLTFSSPNQPIPIVVGWSNHTSFTFEKVISRVMTKVLLCAV